MSGRHVKLPLGFGAFVNVHRGFPTHRPEFSRWSDSWGRWWLLATVTLGLEISVWRVREAA